MPMTLRGPKHPYAAQDEANPDAIVSIDSNKPRTAYLPSAGNDWSTFVVGDDPDPSRGLTRQVKVALATFNNGDQYWVVLDESGTPILTQTLGDRRSVDDSQSRRFQQAKDDRDRAAAQATAASNANAARQERRIVEQHTDKDPATGKWVKWKQYEDGVWAQEEVDPTVSVSTTDINGVKFSIETTRPPSGPSTFRYINLNTGQEVPSLPVDASGAGVTKPTVTYQKGGDGKIYPVTFDPSTGKVVSGSALDIPAETPDDRVDLREVPGPNGEKYLVVTRVPKDTTKPPVIKTYGPDNKEVPGGVPVASPPPTSAGMFIPDPRKPAMGLSEYLQHIAQLRNEKNADGTPKLTEKQYADAFATAHSTALSEATRLDTIVRAQQNNTQNLITQRANDLQAAGTRLNYTGTATNNAYDTALKIAGALTPKSLKAAGGGSILGSIMATQDMRAQQSGGFFNPAQVTVDPNSAAGQVQGIGLGPLQTGVQQATAAATANQAQTQAATPSTATAPGATANPTPLLPPRPVTSPVSSTPPSVTTPGGGPSMQDRTQEAQAVPPSVTTPGGGASLLDRSQEAQAARMAAGAASPTPTATPPVTPVPQVSGIGPRVGQSGPVPPENPNDTLRIRHTQTGVEQTITRAVWDRMGTNQALYEVVPGSESMPSLVTPSPQSPGGAGNPAPDGTLPGASPYPSDGLAPLPYAPPSSYPGAEGDVPKIMSGAAPGSSLFSPGNWFSPTGQQQGIQANAMAMKSLGDNDERPDDMLHVIQTYPNGSTVHWSIRRSDYESRSESERQHMQVVDAQPDPRWTQANQVGKPDQVDGGLIVGARPASTEDPSPITVQRPAPGYGAGGVVYPPAPTRPLITVPGDWPEGVPWQPAGSAPVGPQPRYPYPDQPPYIQTPYNPAPGETGHQPGQPVGMIPSWFGQPTAQAQPNWFAGSAPPQTNQPPIPAVASMHPIVGPMMQQFSHDPDYQQALMQAAQQGGLI